MKKIIAFLFLAVMNSQVRSQISASPVTRNSVALKPENSSAYFIITINGFSCNSETWDDALERDGKRDEVYLVCKTNLLQQRNGSFQTVSEQTRKTVVMGDINNRPIQENRAQAGMADGSRGGIKTGDNIPSNQPWKKTLEPTTNYLPLLVYQGLLSANSNTNLQIIPSIWEWDGPPDFFNKALELINKPFTDLINTAAGNDPVRQMIITRANQDFHFYNILLKRTPSPGTEVVVNRDVFGDPKDRPVGMQLNTVTNQYLYFPVGLQLNFENASAIAETDMGYGKGVFGMQFRDPSELKGDYTIYIQIEKVPVKGQPLTVQPRIPGNFLANKLYTIKNANSGKLIAVTTNGGNTSLVMTEQTGSAAEKWRLRKINDNYYIISNEQTGKNLSCYKTDVGPQLYAYDQNGENQQHWKLITQADGSYIIVNRESDNMPVYQNSQQRPAVAENLSNAAVVKWLITPVN